MPAITHFQIRNFKGAKDVRIDIDARLKNRVITLIGLNESGKTTLLEAISHFPTNDEVVSSIFRQDNEAEHALTLLPIHRRANFTGKIEIIGNVLLDDDDNRKIDETARSMKFEIDPEKPIKNITVRKEYEFKNGDFIPSEDGSNWDGVELHVRKGRRGKFKSYDRPDDIKDDLWYAIADEIENRLPNIVYFPNFLVDIPERIYLSEYDEESDTNKYYRKIIDNIISRLGEDLSLQTHVVDRIENFRSKNPMASWIARLLGDSEKTKIDPVFSKLSVALTREVLGSWGKVFNRPVAAKAIKVDWFVDPSTDRPYAEITVSDGESPYQLHERSLGFRWFFSFLLFTRFGGAKGRPNLFLFDEPAANLHARAQAELLGSFGKLIAAGDFVIYSTHSHHMIKPEWLSSAYIVENDAIDYESNGPEFAYDVRNTNIRATGYRRFVGEHGDRISYFQPVIERLQYVEPAVVAGGPQVLVEGPSDFYAFTYALNRSNWKGKLAFVPGGGAGSLGPMISIALSRGYRFTILLDDDRSGRSAKERYCEIWGLNDMDVATLAAVEPSLKDKRLEDLISPATKQMVRERFGSAKKESVSLYLAEAVATMQDGALTPDSEEALLSIIDRLARRVLGKP